MKRFFAIASALALLTACGTLEAGDANEASEGLSKSQAAEALEEGQLNYDPCDEYGWYGDGQCDLFCPNPDPSCDDDNQDCSSIITFGIHPDTGACHEFANPCDVPDGWELSYSQCPELPPGEGGEDDSDELPDGCIQVIAPAVDPDTGTCQEFPTPCDVPDGWIDVDSCDDVDAYLEPEECMQVVTYGVDPDTGTCHEFPTPCDVPDGWKTAYDGCPPPTDEAGVECHSDSECMVGGCSGELCHHVDNPLSSVCVYLPVFACYDDEYTTCGCFEGTCGWEETDELEQCVEEHEE